MLGVEEPPAESARPGMMGVAIALGVVVVIVAGLVLMSNREPSEPTQAALDQAEQVRDRANLSIDAPTPSLREPAAPVERRAPGRPLNELVPGFSDLLIVTHIDQSGSQFYQLLWGPGSNAAARIRTLEHAVFDRSGNYFARFEPSVWNGSMLAIGSLSAQASGPAAIGVDGFTWHTNQPRRIAYTAEVEVGRRALFAADVAQRPGNSTLTVTYVADIGGARLAAWSDFGFALEADGELLVLGPDGADLGRGPYEFLGTDHDGALLVTDGGEIKRADPSLSELVEPGWLTQVGGQVVSVTASPYRPLLAVDVQEPGGLVTYLASADDLRRVELGGAASLVWASQGRYLVLSRDESERSILVFYDVDADEAYELEMTDLVDSVFTRTP